MTKREPGSPPSVNSQPERAPSITFEWNGAPNGFGAFGIEGAIKCLYPGEHFQIQYYEKPPMPAGGTRVAVLTWNENLHKLDIVTHAPDTQDASYIDSNKGTPPWQLGEGWSNPEGGFRWIAPQATARLDRPQGAARFEMRVLTNGPLLQSTGMVNVHVSLNGVDLAPQSVSQVGWQVLTWNLAAGPAGATDVTIATDPPFHPAGDPRTLGIAIGSFGFR